MAESFIENVNALANATSLATGDIVEDTQTARDEAVASAAEAAASAATAEDNQLLAKDWANKGHNSVVTGVGVDAEYSAYHWKTEAQLLVGDPVVQDSITSVNYTWSSTKLSTDLSLKSNTDHIHNGVYEPVITKNSAFNRAFTGNTGDLGVAETVSRGDHVHTTVYEPLIGAKGTSFNKSFGVASGDVAEGDHNHTNVYMPYVAEKTGYNKAFVVDANAPLADEVSRGNHTHKATGVSYDNTGNQLVTSTTVQGAISQIDTVVASVEQAEKCKLVAGMTDAIYTVAIAAANTPVVVNVGMTVGTNSKNALYSSGVVIDYDIDPTKLVEGQLAGSVTIEVLANKAYAINIAVNGTVVNSTFRTEVGSADKATTGAFSVPISAWVSGLANADVLGITVENLTDTTDVVIYGMNMSFAGQPEGALVASGITITHDDVLARDSDGQHPTSSIYETGNIGVSLDTILASKADFVGTPIDGNLVSMDATGNIVDSGITAADAANHMDLIAVPTLDNIVSMTSGGQSKDAGIRVQDLALLGGTNTQVFEVATATLDTHAVTKLTFDTTVGTLSTAQDLVDHTALSNPHGTTYTDVGAPALVHTHAIADTTLLQDTLDAKYDEISAVTNNFMAFGAGNVVIDSGISLTSTLLVGE